MDYDQTFTLIPLDEVVDSLEDDHLKSEKKTRSPRQMAKRKGSFASSRELRTLDTLPYQISEAAIPVRNLKPNNSAVSIPQSTEAKSFLFNQKSLSKSMLFVASALLMAIFLITNYDKMRPPPPEMEDYQYYSDVSIETV
eukprot:CAMPEP_0182427934 /NCGR_PEP_ID=MMETSP1167-20130531/20897_1 /TAXON_ID=2988 /ORGANISM="Mallomonas Sp, Strain CCMP3275" /LENGTH=139 /DNA_ID=CAMNT_0024610525 /DNA_START=238 /DNA_END=657 /DNA_ORIENTATION=-